MKKTTALFLASLLSLSLFAEAVNLKITYKNQGVSDYTIYIMLGDTKLGSGVSDSNGEVTIEVATLPSKDIDVRGEKRCEGAEKSWDVKGYVTLDDNNYALLELDKPIAEVIESSGGFMTENMIVNSYGLVCGGSNNNTSQQNNPQSINTNTNSNTDSDNTSEPTSSTLTKEEMLEKQKAGYEARINNLEKKINKSQSQIDEGKLNAEKQKDTEYDIQEMQIEKQIAQNNLDRVNTEISKGSLSKEERDQFKSTNKNLKENLKSVKQQRKEVSSTLPSDTSGTSENSDNLEDLASMSTSQLKTKRLNYKSKLGSLKLKLKTRKKYMSDEEIAQTEAEINTLEANIAKIDEEISKREGK